MAIAPRRSNCRWGRQFVRCLLPQILVLLAVSGAFADTVKVTADRALVWTHPSGVSVVLTQLLKDQTAEVVRKVGDWYEIVLPSITFGGEFRTGFIAESQVVIDRVGPASPEVVRAMALPPPRQPGSSFLIIDGARIARGGDLTQSSAVYSPSLLEAGTITTGYRNAKGWMLDVLAGGPVWRYVGIGFGIAYHQRNSPAVVQVLAPHPYFFDTLRPASLISEPLSTRETMLSLPAVFMPPALGRVRVLVFGGLAVFKLSQVVVTGASLDEQYPYDVARIAGVITEDRKGTFTGYHAGADATVFISRYLGLGAGARYSRANIKGFEGETAATDGHAGGASVGGGIRIRF